MEFYQCRIEGMVEVPATVPGNRSAEVEIEALNGRGKRPVTGVGTTKRGAKVAKLG